VRYAKQRLNSIADKGDFDKCYLQKMRRGTILCEKYEKNFKK